MKLSDLMSRGNNNLDLIRVVLALMVIVGHVPAFKIVSDNYVDYVTQFFDFTYSGAAAVKAFFFISGLLVTNSLLKKGDWREYLVSRVFRIWPGLLFVSLCCFVFGFLITTQPETYFSSAWKYVVKNLYMDIQYTLPSVSFISETTSHGGKYSTTVNGSLWTIPWEVKMYIILLAVYLLAKNFRASKTILTIAFSFFTISPLIMNSPLMGGHILQPVSSR